MLGPRPSEPFYATSRASTRRYQGTYLSTLDSLLQTTLTNPFLFFQTSFSSDKHDTRMIAIHFDKLGLSVPVPEGMKVLLIPMAIDGGKVGDERLESLDYLHLDAEVPAEPDFYALLLMCKK